ncbi:hypothetical protein BJV82DRAFT_589666 [Fennellomyces sp. T-0311]|nr:hypothetical protein BJV82DRAFT_589666 [Fennellomyces sp. T-0311]
MYFFKKIYSSIISDLRDTTTTPSDTPAIKMEAAQRMIQQSPRLAQGYLIYGQLYKQQGELYDALSIYQQGLRNVSTCHVEYPKLQKEKNSILFMLATQRPNGNFMCRFPREILYLIFRQLDIRDLVRCSGVCQEWNEFMLEWPKFWDLLWAVTDRVEGQFAEMILRRKTNKLNISPGMESESIFNLLRLVDDSDNQLVKKLTLCEASVGFFIFDRTPDILQSLKFPIRELELIDCYTSLQTTFYISLLLKLSNFTHVSFSQTAISPTIRTNPPVRVPKEQDIIKPNITFPFLTSLKLSAIYLDKSATIGIAQILRQSPNLVHLYLDTRATILQSYITRQATKHCPFLETLVFSKSAMMVQTLSTTSEDSPTIVKTKRKPPASLLLPRQLKLRRFVFTEYSVYYNTNYVPSVIKKARQSLELLVLCINCTYTLNCLPDFGGSRLREVQLFPDESVRPWKLL